MDLLGIFVAVARGFHLAAVISAFGAVVFHVLVWRKEDVDAISARSLRLLTSSLVAALVSAAPWLLLQAAQTSGSETLAEMFAATPLVAGYTTFGTSLLLRVVLLSAALVLIRWRPTSTNVVVLGLVGAALALQSGFSHAIAQDDWTVRATHTLHVVAAGAWLGALLPLWLSLRTADARQSRRLLIRFSHLGIACVATLLGTAYVQFFTMVGDLPPLLGTRYGHLIILKVAVFLLLLVCAALNRLVWTPRAIASAPSDDNRALRLTIAAEFAIGFAMVATASSLASTPPAIHVQPDWPFSVQFDIAGFYYPPMRDKLERCAAAIVAALVLIAVGFRVQRFVWIPFATASALLLSAPFPQPDIVFKPAHPKTFYVTPSTFPVASIARGAEIFEANCARCHDPSQRVIPAFSTDMPVIPPALSSSRVARLRDGNLFWAIAHGIDDPRGGQSMPGFEVSLSEDDIWNLIDYLRALSAPSRGAELREVRAPSFNASCPNGETTSSTALRGHVVRLVVAQEAAITPLSSVSSTKTIIITKGADAPSTLCAIAELEAWTAYSAVAGVAPSALPGTVFLIDANGWLRYAFTPWRASSEQIARAADEIGRNPLPRAYSAHNH